MLEGTAEVGEGGIGVGVMVGSDVKVDVVFTVMVEGCVLMIVAVSLLVGDEFNWGGEGVRVNMIERSTAVGFCMEA